MISADSAFRIVLDNAREFGIEEVSLTASYNRVLASEVHAIEDFPPYNRVTMDGIAIAYAAYDQNQRAFVIENIQAAGTPQLALTDQQKCIEVMTGAVLPAHTDTVIPYEQCEIKDGIATIHTSAALMQNVHRQGLDAKRGDLLIRENTRITPAVTSILASQGMARVPVKKLPRVAICSTGDELVDIEEKPAAHQVHRSNVYMIAAALQAEGITASLFHFSDNEEELLKGIEALRHQFDLILFSGAVSKGKYDHLPQVLLKLGMQTLFHQVAQRPGKPILFGRFPHGTVIFGLPGNPVSTFICYQVFVRGWLYACVQIPPAPAVAALTQQVSFKPSLTFHLPVSITLQNGVLSATPAFGANSGDMVALLKVNGIMTLPPDKDFFSAGEKFPVQFL